MSFSAGFAAGLAVGRKKWGDAGGGDDWQPPEWWIPVPEPEDYDIYALIIIKKDLDEFGIQIVNDKSVSNVGVLMCDWGDGITESAADTSYLTHTYNKSGQYLVHFIGNIDKCFWRAVYPAYNRPMQIAKSGSKILLCTQEFDDRNYFSYLIAGNRSLKYFETKNENAIPISNSFTSCVALEKLIYPKKINKIGLNMFADCYGINGLDLSEVEEIKSYGLSNCYKLKKIDIPKCNIIESYAVSSCYGLTKVYALQCTYIGKHAFADCNNLTYIYAPKCTHIDDFAFQNCYNLQEIIVADGCTFGSNCFQNCNNLYPRPDGSTN